MSDRYSERARGNSPVSPQRMMQLHRRQKFLTPECFLWGCRSSGGGCGVSPLGCLQACPEWERGSSQVSLQRNGRSPMGFSGSRRLHFQIQERDERQN